MTARLYEGSNKAAPVPVQSELFSKVNCVAHGFFSRCGGVSNGIYSSLNCGFGSGDDINHIKSNRALAVSALGANPENLITAYQVHGRTALHVDRPQSLTDSPKVDALVTDQPGITLGILTADCAPVFLVDETVGVIGAAHAGWRGVSAGILESTIGVMGKLGANPSNITAAIGPCIGFDSYEVGPEFPALFLDERSDNSVFFKEAINPNHLMFDLAGYAAQRLRNSGILEVDQLLHDTFTHESAFFSYRRALHRKETDYGRLLSALVLRD